MADTPFRPDQFRLARIGPKLAARSQNPPVDAAADDFLIMHTTGVEELLALENQTGKLHERCQQIELRVVKITAAPADEIDYTGASISDKAFARQLRQISCCVLHVTLPTFIRPRCYSLLNDIHGAGNVPAWPGFGEKRDTP